jgi:hypothetical protein
MLLMPVLSLYVRRAYVHVSLRYSFMCNTFFVLLLIAFNLIKNDIMKLHKDYTTVMKMTISSYTYQLGESYIKCINVNENVHYTSI